MAALTRTTFYEAVINYLDATGVDANLAATTTTPRWDKSTILAVGDNVMSEEWSGILDQNQAYRVNTVSVTTASDGTVAVASLTTGSGDTQKVFYRILSGFTDGTVLYRETDFRNVPLGSSTNYQTPYEYLYYLMGANWQLLPVASGTALSVVVSYTPPSMGNLATDASTIDFPAGAEYILVWRTAAKLLLKGGTQTGPAAALDALADDARKNMYGQIGRLTTRPNSLMFQDLAQNWNG